MSPPAQRTGVQLRPHQETKSVRKARPSPWYITTGARGTAVAGYDELRGPRAETWYVSQTDERAMR